MRSKTKAALRKVAFIISGCGFVLYFVAYLIPFWSRFRQPGTNIDFRYGIFITCITDSFKSTCNFIHLTVVYGNWVKVVQGVGGTGLVFYFISMATGFLAFYWKNRVQKTLLYVSASCGFAAGIFIAVTVFLYANSNESQQDSLDFGFYFAIISIVPSLIGGIFQVFNGKQVIIPTRAYEEKKKKKRMEIAREHIIDAMMNMSPDDLKSHPPMNTMIVRDTKELMADDLPDDDGARPGPSTDPNYVYSTDYETDAEVDNVLDQLDDEEEGSEDDFVESEDEGFGSQEKEEKEEKVEPSYAEEILKAREQVKFEEEKPVKQEPKVEEEEVVVVKKERKPKEDFRGTKSAAVARQRLAYRQNKIAILKVDCGKCPWEHTIMKFAHDLTELDLPNVVRYIEGAENVAAYMLGIGREECIAQQYHPLEFSSKDYEKEMELRRAERRLKEEKRRKMERRQKKEFAKISKTLKYKRQMIQSQSMESVNRAVLPPIETMSDRSSSRASSEASMSIIDENYRSTTKSATLSTSRLEEENARKREINERLDKIIQEIDKPSRASFFSERSAKSRSRETTAKTITGKPYPLETYAENETIIEDTFEGPGLSEDEDEMPIEHRSPLKSAFYRDHRDRMSAATHATGMTYLTSYTEASRRTAKTSARTYASSNATTLLPRPVTVVFTGIRDSPPKPSTAEKEMPPKKRPKNRKSKAKGQTAAYTSRTGKSKKSATSTKTRKSQKERRVAIVREDCNKCEFDAKTMKYEEDLTDYERRKIERVIDRTKDNIHDSEL